jgi:simple sugar transport system permease protein
MLDSVIDQLARSLVASAVPLVLAGCGELVAERAGVINVGIEGLMLTGCIAGFAVAVASGSCWLGLGAAVLAGVALAGLFAAATVWLRADQIVTGMALNLLAVGISGTLYQLLQQHQLVHLAAGQGFERASLPGAGLLSRIPLLGALVADQYGLAYVTAALCVALRWALPATRGGLVVRALGEAPQACAAAGFSVRGWRTMCVLFAGACCGAAGAYLSIMRTHTFVPLMTGGKGFLVLALVIFGRWNVGGLVAGCVCFGALDGLQEGLQGGGLDRVIPYQALQALPYLVALNALALLGRSAHAPPQLGRPWPERP